MIYHLGVQKSKEFVFIIWAQLTNIADYIEPVFIQTATLTQLPK